MALRVVPRYKSQVNPKHPIKPIYPELEMKKLISLVRFEGRFDEACNRLPGRTCQDF